MTQLNRAANDSGRREGSSFSEIVDRFEEAWDGSEPPRIADFVHESPEQLTLLNELVHIDIELRLKAGLSAIVEEYLEQFPALAGDRVRVLELIATEREFRSRRGESVTDDEYARRFPEFATQLLVANTSPHTPQPVENPSPSELKELGGYRVLKKLGEGGMGMVFEAEDVRLKRRVALKVMKPGIAANDQYRQRFLREAQAAAAVEHEHICPIYQVGEENGIAFIAMPFLKGESLDVRLRREKTLPIAEAIRIAGEVAEGLSVAHDAGLVHRDVKPANVWLEEDLLAGTRKVSGALRISGHVRILDFGLARPTRESAELTQTGAIVGTPAYMAPEQARSSTVDHRADLFSLGVMLYEMTTGQRPFKGTDPMSILTSLAVDEPPVPTSVNPAIPSALSDVILRLLSKSPEERPADSRAVSEALLSVLMQTSQPIIEVLPPALKVPLATAADATPLELDTLNAAPIDGAVASSPPARRDRRWMIAALLAAGCIVIGYFVFANRKDASPSPPEQNLPATASKENPIPLKGWIDIVVWNPTNPDRRGARIRDEGLLPLTPRDMVRVEAQVNRAAYLYVLWIDGRGQVLPVYPWRDGKWEALPLTEVPVPALDLPADQTSGWPLDEDSPAGMETLILLVRDSPFPQGFDLRAKLAGLPAVTQQSLRTVVWFENGQPVRNEPQRAPILFDSKRVDDPLLAIQRLIHERLGNSVAYTRAVSFAYHAAP